MVFKKQRKISNIILKILVAFFAVFTINSCDDNSLNSPPDNQNYDGVTLLGVRAYLVNSSMTNLQPIYEGKYSLDGITEDEKSLSFIRKFEEGESFVVNSYKDGNTTKTSFNNSKYSASIDYNDIGKKEIYRLLDDSVTISNFVDEDGMDVYSFTIGDTTVVHKYKRITNDIIPLFESSYIVDGKKDVFYFLKMNTSLEVICQYSNNYLKEVENSGKDRIYKTSIINKSEQKIDTTITQIIIDKKNQIIKKELIKSKQNEVDTTVSIYSGSGDTIYLKYLKDYTIYALKLDEEGNPKTEYFASGDFVNYHTNEIISEEYRYIDNSKIKKSALIYTPNNFYSQKEAIDELNTRNYVKYDKFGVILQEDICSQEYDQRLFSIAYSLNSFEDTVECIRYNSQLDKYEKAKFVYKNNGNHLYFGDSLIAKDVNGKIEIPSYAKSIEYYNATYENNYDSSFAKHFNFVDRRYLSSWNRYRIDQVALRYEPLREFAYDNLLENSKVFDFGVVDERVEVFLKSYKNVDIDYVNRYVKTYNPQYFKDLGYPSVEYSKDLIGGFVNCHIKYEYDFLK